MAGLSELAAAAQRGMGSDAEGTGAQCGPRRGRRARLRGPGVSGKAGARGGAAQRRPHYSGEGAHAREIEREGGGESDV